MIYGFYKWKIWKTDKRTNIDKFFEFLAIAVAIFMITRFVISGVYSLAPVFETIIVIAEIFWTMMLARKKIIGWYSYFVMSVLASSLVIFINPNPALILWILELSSLYFYYNWIKNFSKK